MSALIWCAPSSFCTSFMAAKIGRSGQPVQKPGGRTGTVCDRSGIAGADVLGARWLGSSLGAITAIDATGGAIGPWVTGLLYDQAGSYQLGFGVMTGLITIAFVAAMLVRTPLRPSH